MTTINTCSKCVVTRKWSINHYPPLMKVMKASSIISPIKTLQSISNNGHLYQQKNTLPTLKSQITYKTIGGIGHTLTVTPQWSFRSIFFFLQILEDPPKLWIWISNTTDYFWHHYLHCWKRDLDTALLNFLLLFAANGSMHWFYYIFL